MYIRYKSSSELLSLGQTYDGDDLLQMEVGVDYINDFIRDYEDKIEKKKVSKAENNR
jgi:long-subunit fatty acid transport protein